MADNTAQNGTDVIATDELTTLNGGAVSGFKAQRMKAGFGVDANLRDVSAQFPLPVDTDSKRAVTYKGRVASFRTLGRAGTTGQKLFSIFNAHASILVDVEKIMVSYYATAARVVAPPGLKVFRITAEPTNGTALTNKVAFDTGNSSNASVTFRGDSTADGTGSGTTLTHAIANGAVTDLLTQIYTPRNLTLVGYNGWDRQEFFENDNVILRQNQGLLVFLDYNLATMNPVSDMWSVLCQWTEYTAA